MAGLLDPRQGDGSYVVNRPSKWQQTWDIFAPYITAPAYAVKGLMDADPYTLLTDTGPAADEAVANSFNAAGAVTAGGSVVPKPANALNMGIRAFHASPHSFDKFEWSPRTRGTGEGAQAYGDGLYFAENERIAQWYRDALSGKQYIFVPGPDEVAAKHGQNVVDMVYSNSGDPNEIQETIKRLRSAVSRNLADFGVSDVSQLKSSYDGDLASQTIKMAKNAGALEAAIKSGDVKLDPGHMYEVNIDADPDAFLDWDKPLSEQPSAVADALRKIGFEDAKWPYTGLIGPNSMLSKNSPGQEIYNAVGKERGSNSVGRPRDINKAGASEALREAGIPGIKYLDAGSRSAGDGSRNYVVFDDNLISILRKYGLAGLLGGSAAMNAMQDEPQEQY